VSRAYFETSPLALPFSRVASEFFKVGGMTFLPLIKHTTHTTQSLFSQKKKI
jgi:hypothetical protein